MKTNEKPKECTCPTNPAPMFHGRDCPVLAAWKKSQSKANTDKQTEDV